MNGFDERLKKLAQMEDCPTPDGFDGRLADRLARLPGKKRRPRAVKWALAAACLCLTMAGTAAAVHSMKVHVKQLDPEQGVTVEMEVTPYPVDELGEKLRKHYQELYDDTLPTEFDSIQALEEFVGVPLRGNPYLESGTAYDIGLSASSSLTLSALFTVEGELFEWEAVISLDVFGEDGSDGWIVSDGRDVYTQEEYPMANGEVAVIVTDNSGDRYDAEWNSVSAWFVADGIRYKVGFGDGGSPERYARQLALLYRILDAFE